MQKRTLRDRVAVLAAAALISACASTHQTLTIEQQGSFAVCGTVITAPGTFDPIRQGAYNQVSRCNSPLGIGSAVGR